METNQNQDRINSINNRTKKILKIFGIIVLVILIIGILQGLLKKPASTSGKGWEVVSTQSYVRDGKECMGYRVYVSSSCSDTKYSILKAVSNDSYYKHTVWFYHSKLDADGSGQCYDSIED